VTTERGTRSSRKLETVKGTAVATETQYDPLGRRKQVSHTGGSGSILWRWQYDSLGRVVVEEDPDAGTKTTVYDDAARRATRTDAKGQTTLVEYDLSGRLARRVTGVGETRLLYGEERSGCFNKGALTTVTSPSSRLETCFGETGQPKKVTRWVDGVPYTVEAEYDTAGRTKSTKYPDGEVVGPVGYDEAGHSMGTGREPPWGLAEAALVYEAGVRGRATLTMGPMFTEAGEGAYGISLIARAHDSFPGLVGPPPGMLLRGGGAYNEAGDSIANLGKKVLASACTNFETIPGSVCR
jgi:YD repeat-containing protein